MIYSPDYIRDILISVSKELIPDKYGYVQPVYPKDLAKHALSKYPENETLYWIRRLMDEHILIKGKQYIDEGIPQIKDLSLEAYRFINAVKEPSVWEIIKPKLLDLGINSLPMLLKHAISLSTIQVI